MLLHYVCASRGSAQRQTVLTLEGLPEAHLLTTKWRLLLHELYERIGIDCDNVTLVIKRLDLLPSSVISQLLSLLATGEIPGSFSLEEQIKMATRVRDERLVEMDNQFLAQSTHIRQEAELLQNKELVAIKHEEKESLSINSATFYQEWERKHQATVTLRLAQVQLRYQQDCDDYTRRCEVETESVTTTIMSLMRPLGITSGRWQQIVDRIRKRLRVVFFVDASHRHEVQGRIPALLSSCSVVSCPLLPASDLQTVLYGHYHAETHRLMRAKRFVKNPEPCQWEKFVVFIEKVELKLPQIVRMAVEIHLAVARLTKETQSQSTVPTCLAMALSGHFARFLERAFKKESESVAKAEWFLYVYLSMSQGLEKLKDGDGELRERLHNCEQQVGELESTIAHQQDDCDRVRDMMRRFQATAEEQVQVTNEMEKQAQVELHVPLACLEEANAALLLIEKRHIVEIKSFNSPPLLVHLVLDAVCVMFSLEPTWENARRVLSDSNVVQNMLSYDKDAMSDELLTKLEMRYMGDERFHREEVEKQSLAASMMVIWVRAIYQYATTRRMVKPTLDKLERAQARLRLLMQEFHVSKQRMAEADDALLTSRTSLEVALTLRLKTTTEIESREVRLASGQLVLEFLAEDKLSMEKVIENVERSRYHSLPVWNALLSAAFVTYAGHFHLKDRKWLFKEWQRAYWNNTLTDGDGDETTCCLIPSLHVRLKEKRVSDSDDDEEMDSPEEDVLDLFLHTQQGGDQHWKLVSGGGVCFSQRRLQDALFLSELNAAGFARVLLTNYTHELEDLVLQLARNAWQWSHFFMVSVKADDFHDVLSLAVENGHQLLVLDVEPLDGEREVGRLAPVFQWKTCVVDGCEQLFVQTYPGSASELTANAVGEESTFSNTSSGQERMIPIHPSFRIILATHQPYSAFGEAVVKIPSVDASLHASDVQYMLLDKMWNLGFDDDASTSITTISAETTSLKLALRELMLLATEVNKMQSQLTKLIQEAAVHGDFQLSKMEQLREEAHASNELRANMLRKRLEVESEVVKARKRAGFASVGAALFNSFNATISASTIHGQPPPPRSNLVMTGSKSPPLAFQLFLPMYFSALTSTATVSSSTVPVPPMILSASSASPGFMRGQQHHSQTALTRGSFRVLSAPTGSVSGASSGNVSLVLTHMLQLLMPLVGCESDWWRFNLQLILTLEGDKVGNHHNQQMVDRRPTMVQIANIVEPISELKQPVEVGETQGNEHDDKSTEHYDAVEKQQAPRAVTDTTVGSVESMLMLKKLERQDVACCPQELDSILQELRALEPKRVVHLMIHGVAVNDDASTTHESRKLFDLTSRSRLARIRFGLTLLPHLIFELCEQMLAVYGVLVTFAIEDDVALSLVSLAKPSSSLQEEHEVVGLSHRSLLLSTKKASNPNSNTTFGWLRQIAALPEVAGVLIVSTQPLESFAFIQRAFFQTIFVHEIRVAILQQLFARSFRSPSELNDLYSLPKSVFLSNVTQQQAFLETGADLQSNPLLTIQSFDELRKLEKEKPDTLETTPLALVNMQCVRDPAHWEGLFQILHRSYQHTTSVAFERHHNSTSIHQQEKNNNPSEKIKLSQPPLGHVTPTGTSSSPVTVSPMRAPTTRRLSTTQSLLHRHSDVVLVAPSYPRLLVLVDKWETLPAHLQKNLLCLHDESDEMDTSKCSHATSGSTTRRWTFKKCVQSTLLRFAFHPCRESLQTAVLADESSKLQADTVSGDLDSVALSSATELQAPSLWQLLSSLVLFHALLIFRSNTASTRSYYRVDNFVTAVDQLFHCFVQLKAGKEPSNDVTLERIQQQVVLSAYARTATAANEVAMLRHLYRECHALVGGGRAHRSSENLSQGPGIPLGHQNSSMHNLTRRCSSSFTVGRNSLLSGSSSVGSSPRAGATASPAASLPPHPQQISSVLAFLDFPLESLTSKTGDVDQWLAVCWNFSETLEKGRHDVQLRRLFTGHSEDRERVCGRGLVSRTVPAWADSQYQDQDLVYAVPLTEAEELIQILLSQPAIASQLSISSVLDTNSSSCSVGCNEKTQAHELKPTSSCQQKNMMGNLVELITKAFATAFNTQVAQIHAYLSCLLAEVHDLAERDLGSQYSRGQVDTHIRTDNAPSSLLRIGNLSVRAQVVALLQNEIPVQLRCSFDPSELSFAVTSQWSLRDLLAHYQCWRHFLSASPISSNISSGPPVWLWAPALSPAIPIAHVIQAAKLSYCAQQQGVDDSDACSVRFSLRDPLVANELRPSEADETAQRSEDHARQDAGFPGHMFAVFDGLCVVNAAWNADAGYLEPIGEQTRPTPRRVLLLCSLEPLEPGLPPAGTRAAQPHATLRLFKQSTQLMRLVPLLGCEGIGSSLLFEVELPVTTGLVQSFVTPYLVLATPASS